jgi:hypothetical protein
MVMASPVRDAALSGLLPAQSATWARGHIVAPVPCLSCAKGDMGYTVYLRERRGPVARLRFINRNTKRFDRDIFGVN